MACFNSYPMNLSPSLLKSALLDAQQCNGIAPATCQMLIKEGWAEWVDHEFGTPIDENSPRSLMRLTVAGSMQLEALANAPMAQPASTKPITTHPMVPPRKPSRVTLGFRLRFRSHVTA
ncbi:hypothetical protein WKW79_02515 [Variovorax robiniae]|uniref:Uncharacterized protein n=1 Tax=Variovorax robiniae TaxID=1836199 RepID=A0ABU8X0V5_9BURK